MQQEPFILPARVSVRDPRGNRYVIESVLGKGPFGGVYLVREWGTRHDLFALKEVINPDKNARERFAFECEVLKRLNHRALPRVHSVFENDKLKRVYLLMDYIAGQNLEVLRGEQPGKCLSMPVVQVLMAPIVDALLYLHAQDPPIVHRDIKPANIIVPAAGGEAMLADFGSAKEYVPGAATTVVGRRSPGYAALEQYSSGTNPATDVYGLGATCYALLTGSAPIDAPARFLGMMSTGVDPLKPANLLKPAIPPAVAEALQRAMALKIDDRFQSVEGFWQAVMDPVTQRLPRVSSVGLSQTSPAGRVIEGTESVGQVQSAPRSKKRNALRIFAGVLVIFMIGIGFFSYLRGLTALLLCCLGALLVALVALLFDFSRARASQKKSEAVRGIERE